MTAQTPNDADRVLRNSKGTTSALETLRNALRIHKARASK
ncbi:hypothetical protein AKJ09_07479 [Labilithrix luteola]|uniref:Uncharacterized protein n=1 Tax=Labilithrix luteola TaxID=1391654 RepID=A0A0K1Q4R2_9BACT|nr:hypothetical protein AKJ09_07479 [Labilithrix luteola]